MSLGSRRMAPSAGPPPRGNSKLCFLSCLPTAAAKAWPVNGSVWLVLPDGRMKTYPRGIAAARVMVDFPGMLVTWDPSQGFSDDFDAAEDDAAALGRGDLRVLSDGDLLFPGRTYRLRHFDRFFNEAKLAAAVAGAGAGAGGWGAVGREVQEGSSESSPDDEERSGDDAADDRDWGVREEEEEEEEGRGESEEEEEDEEEAVEAALNSLSQRRVLEIGTQLDLESSSQGGSVVINDDGGEEEADVRTSSDREAHGHEEEAAALSELRLRSVLDRNLLRHASVATVLLEGRGAGRSHGRRSRSSTPRPRTAQQQQQQAQWQRGQEQSPQQAGRGRHHSGLPAYTRRLDTLPKDYRQSTGKVEEEWDADGGSDKEGAGAFGRPATARERRAKWRERRGGVQSRGQNVRREWGGAELDRMRKQQQQQEQEEEEEEEEYKLWLQPELLLEREVDSEVLQKMRTQRHVRDALFDHFLRCDGEQAVAGVESLKVSFDSEKKAMRESLKRWGEEVQRRRSGDHEGAGSSREMRGRRMEREDAAVASESRARDGNAMRDSAGAQRQQELLTGGSEQSHEAAGGGTKLSHEPGVMDSRVHPLNDDCDHDKDEEDESSSSLPPPSSVGGESDASSGLPLQRSFKRKDLKIEMVPLASSDSPPPSRPHTGRSASASAAATPRSSSTPSRRQLSRKFSEDELNVILGSFLSGSSSGSGRRASGRLQPTPRFVERSGEESEGREKASFAAEARLAGTPRDPSGRRASYFRQTGPKSAGRKWEGGGRAAVFKGGAVFRRATEALTPIFVARQSRFSRQSQGEEEEHGKGREHGGSQDVPEVHSGVSAGRQVERGRDGEEWNGPQHNVSSVQFGGVAGNRVVLVMQNRQFSWMPSLTRVEESAAETEE